MGVHFSKAAQLFDARRPDLAEQLVRRDLADDPNDARAQALLGLCLAGLKRPREALEAAREAIRLSPDLPFGHYALAVVHCRRGRRGLRAAKAALERAIRLEPRNAEYYFLLAAVEHDRQRFRVALRLAEQGLSIDPTHVRCLNIRGLALQRLGRHAEVDPTFHAALARNPVYDYTHAMRGWALWNGCDPLGAEEHFREALRLNPENRSARRGLKMAGLVARGLIAIAAIGLRLRLLRLVPGRGSRADRQDLAPNWWAGGLLALTLASALACRTGFRGVGAPYFLSLVVILGIAALSRIPSHAAKYLKLAAFIFGSLWLIPPVVLSLHPREVGAAAFVPTGDRALAIAVGRMIGLPVAPGMWLFLVGAILPRRLADRVRRRKMGEDGLFSSSEGLGCP